MGCNKYISQHRFPEFTLDSVGVTAISDTVSVIIELSKRRLCEITHYSFKYQGSASGSVVRTEPFFLISVYDNLTIL